MLIVEKPMIPGMRTESWLEITVLRFQDYEVMYDLDNVIAVIQQYIEDFEKRHTPPIGIPLVQPLLIEGSH